MKVWLFLIILSLTFGIICGVKIKNIAVGILISAITPITIFSLLILYEEYFLPYQGGGASMWPIAILFGGTTAAFCGVVGYSITRLVNKTLFLNSKQSLTNGTGENSHGP